MSMSAQPRTEPQIRAAEMQTGQPFFLQGSYLTVDLLIDAGIAAVRGACGGALQAMRGIGRVAIDEVQKAAVLDEPNSSPASTPPISAWPQIGGRHPNRIVRFPEKAARSALTAGRRRQGDRTGSRCACLRTKAFEQLVCLLALFDILKWQVGLPSDRIMIKVERGIVTLTGEVDWQFQRADAAHAVHKLSGVINVVNQIRVSAPVRASEIKEKIQKALQRSAEVEASAITVQTEGGRVVLLAARFGPGTSGTSPNGRRGQPRVSPRFRTT